jgi:hypothetical protein
MLHTKPTNLKLAEYKDLFTGETEETIQMRHGVKYHIKLGKGEDLWSDEKVTSDGTNDRLLLSDYNMDKIYVVNIFNDVKFQNV